MEPNQFNYTPQIQTTSPQPVAPTPQPETSPSQPTAPAPQPITPVKKSNSMMIIAIVCLVLALAGFGFGAYFFIDSQNKSSEIASLKSQANTSTTTESSDQKFASYVDNLVSGIKNENYTYGFLSLQVGGTTAYVTIDNDLNLILQFGDIKYTVATDIIDCELVWLGNGGGPYLYFVDKTGAVGATEDLSTADLSARAPKASTNVSSEPNIIAIKNITFSTGHAIALIDIDGKLHQF